MTRLSRQREAVLGEVRSELAQTKRAVTDQHFQVGNIKSRISALTTINRLPNQRRCQRASGPLSCLPRSPACRGVARRGDAAGQTALGSGVAVSVVVGTAALLIAMLVNMNGGDTAKAGRNKAEVRDELREG